LDLPALCIGMERPVQVRADRGKPDKQDDHREQEAQPADPRATAIQRQDVHKRQYAFTGWHYRK